MIRRKLLPLLLLAWCIAAVLGARGSRAEDVAAPGEPASSAAVEDALKLFEKDDPDATARAVTALGAAGGARAIVVLEALRDGRLAVGVGEVYVHAEDGSFTRAADGAPASAPGGGTRTPLVNNAVRRLLLPTLATLELASPDAKTRLAAAEELAKRPVEGAADAARAAYERERDESVRSALALVIAEMDLSSEDSARRAAAVRLLGESGRPEAKPELERLASTETDAAVRAAAASALAAIERRQMGHSLFANLFYGASLGSILLLAALGLAISFGVMRVINMAHGEMLMLGAYATYAVQRFFEARWPAHLDLYLVAAVPFAFLVCALVGVVLERTVVRFLYGRPLETLLATFGVSLVLIQTVRVAFGAQNVLVANPSFLSGGVTVMGDVVLSYNRIAVIAFAAVVVGFVWLVLNRTRLGLQVRAVTQNRAMAAAMGIPTGRVDMWTFGLGAGVGGLGGVALSQLGNVGPELGQQYIVDSFMVVVLGGVGKLAGSIVAALGLGVVNKMLEPFSGAVMGKIVVLACVILFIQKRPQGLFARAERAG